KVEPAPAPAPVVVAAPAPAPIAPVAPAAVEAPTLAKLSPAAVDSVASTHRKDLSKCEGMDELKGEVSVRFEIDASGRVVKSQVSSTLGKPKVAGCILRTVQSWTFPKPGTGGATGVYAASFQ